MGNDTMSEIFWLKTFAGNLRDILEEYGYSQRDLADYTDISEGTISKYISARQMPSIRSLVNMSMELGILFDEFMDFGCKID